MSTLSDCACRGCRQDMLGEVLHLVDEMEEDEMLLSKRAKEDDTKWLHVGNSLMLRRVRRHIVQRFQEP